jgi:hypothetical protein
MADCSSFPQGSPSCQTIQVIEPDPTLPTSTIPAPGFDPSLTEQGNVILSSGVGIVSVTFSTVKQGDYRFEYLYVDALGLATPEIIPVVPVSQSVYGFTVDLGAQPVIAGYILRWRVVVVTIVTVPGSLVDSPEAIRIQLPLSNTLTVPFANPRSNTQYGFSELRVENLTDLPSAQNPILAQVITKTLANFTVALSPTPNSTNYFLVARTP